MIKRLILTIAILSLIGALLKAEPIRVYVEQDGSGDFTTVQAAIMSIPEGYAEQPVQIYIGPGEYHEVIYIQREKNYFSLIGEHPLTTRIVHSLHANMEAPEGGRLGTFRTPTLTIDADNVTLSNLTVENRAGPVGQALALRADGDRLVFENCIFEGWQDTIFLNRGRHYFHECRIVGSTDYIFGGATALFDDCEIRSRKSSYVTAASTPQDHAFGFVFWGCRFTSTDTDSKSYLGRPWRDHSAVLVLNSYLGEHIREEGWHNWSRPEREKTARYLEYNNTGPGAALEGRVPWSGVLDREVASAITRESVLAGQDGWNPIRNGRPFAIQFEAPAAVWTEALPIGNGRLGAMVHGGVAREHLQFNEDTLWEGTVRQYQHEGAYKVLGKLRKLLAEGRQDEAEALAMEKFMSIPLRQLPYQPFGDLYIDFEGHEEVEDYRRWLDLSTGVSHVEYRQKGTIYRREAFSSYPAQVLVQRLEADRSGALTIKVGMGCLHGASEIRVNKAGDLILSGRTSTEGGLEFEARVRVIAEGGRVKTGSDSIEVIGADSVTVLLAADTSFIDYKTLTADPAIETTRIIEQTAVIDYDDLKAVHLADHRGLFKRMTMDLGTSEADLQEASTVSRLERADKRDDPDLVELFFQYGRYLLISSSRPGTQPANLQGIWNPHLKPPWESKYTLNINAEMNYWPAEVAALEECAEPFFRMIEELSESGRETARAHYAADGWVVHHNTDLWRGSAPINNSNHGIWPTGSAWLCLHLWEHWRYGGDEVFLRERAYPILREASEFYLDFLVEDPETGWLISGPSNSPEHGGLVMGPTMDHQLIRGLFEWTAEAAGILGIDAEFAAELSEKRALIAPNQIGQHGQLQEWLEDIDDPNNRHRHVSHLWGVFPGEDITWAEPALMEAARQSLELRGDGGTGWALGWKVSLWARFLDGDRAHQLLMNQLNLVRDNPDGTQSKGGGGTYPNLFDAHPPFQIDGNFAATAGICEMLVQSHMGEIDILPALPSLWGSGTITGLRVRGGLVVDLAWRDGELETIHLTAQRPVKTTLRYGDERRTIELERGHSVRFGNNLSPFQYDY